MMSVFLTSLLCSAVLACVLIIICTLILPRILRRDPDYYEKRDDREEYALMVKAGIIQKKSKKSKKSKSKRKKRNRKGKRK